MRAACRAGTGSMLMPILRIGSEILVNSLVAGNQYRPDVAATNTGGFIIAWQDESGQSGDNGQGDIRYKKFDAFGQPQPVQGFNANDDIRANIGKNGAQSDRPFRSVRMASSSSAGRKPLAFRRCVRRAAATA